MASCAHVKVPADPNLEIAAISDVMGKKTAPHGHNERDRHPAAALGGKALLFENVAGHSIPLAINTFGSYWRVCEALGCDSLDALADRVQALIKPEVPTGILDKMKKGMDLLKIAGFPPKSVRSGICQQVVLEGAGGPDETAHPAVLAARR
ncbi:MAG: UbiD family decarboxylase [Tepidisphaeraceae bacterium]